MATELEEQLLRQNKILRDQIARLLGQKVELERQLDDLSRDRAQTGVDTIVAALARSVRDADAAVLALADNAPRFTVGEIDATFRGTVVASTAGVGLRLPVPEYGVQPGHLGSIRLSMSAIPPPVTAPAPVVMTPPSPDERLRASLEQVQVAFSQRQGAGKAAADDIVQHATTLLASADARNTTTGLANGLDGIASGLTRSAKALSARERAADVEPYRNAAKGLQGVSREVRGAGSVKDPHRTRSSEILDTLRSQPPSPAVRKPERKTRSQPRKRQR